MKHPKFIKVKNSKDAVQVLEGKTIYAIHDEGLHLKMNILNITKVEPLKKREFRIWYESLNPGVGQVYWELSVDGKGHIQSTFLNCSFFAYEIDALKYARDVTKDRKKALTQDLHDWNKMIQDLTTACE